MGGRAHSPEGAAEDTSPLETFITHFYLPNRGVMGWDSAQRQAGAQAVWELQSKVDVSPLSV